MNKYLLFLLISTFGRAYAAEKIDEIEQYEIRTYSPQKRGVSDLAFEARFDNLTSQLSKSQIYGKLVDVSFKIYWISPSDYKIEVQGMPKGFPEAKASLANAIKNKLEFVLPEKFSEKFKDYTLKAETIADGKLIHAVDATYTLAVPEIDIVIDKTGQLKTVETRAPMSAVKSEFFYSLKAWSNNKYVLDKIIQTSNQGPTKFTTINAIEYENVNGIGFPSRIAVKNVAEMAIPAKGKEKAKKVKNETITNIRFTKYEVNTGKAQRYMHEGLQR